MNTARTEQRILSLVLVLFLTLLVFGGALAAAPAIPHDDKGLPLWEIARWVDAPIHMELPDRAALDELLATVPIASFHRDQISLVYTSPKSYHLEFEPRVTVAESRQLTAAGYTFTALPDLDRAGREAVEKRWAAQAAAGGKALLFGEKGTYPTHAQIGTDLAAVAAAHPSICRTFSWGQSVQGRDQWGIVISADVNNTAAEPEVRLSSTMHGDEPPGMVMLINLVHYLAENYNQPGYEDVTDLVNTTEITIMPLHNPDGYVADTRYNADGVDLNRNFLEPGGSDPVLAQENVNYRNVALSHHFVVSENGHSGALVVNYPWDYTYTLCPDDAAAIQLSLAYSTTNLPMYNGSFPQGITNGAAWYVALGTVQDWVYAMTDCIDVTIEYYNTKWPAESVLDGLWDDNRQSFMNFIKASHYGINGVVTGSDTGLPLEATVTVVGNSETVGTDPAHGDYYKLLDTGSYDVTFTASGYITRTFTAVATTWGVPTVLDVVLDPVAHGDVQGVVTDLAHNGLDAQVNFYTEPLGEYVTTAVADGAAGGAYTANLIYGDYRVDAVVSGYVTQSQQVTVGSVPATVDFRLGQAEEVVLMADDFEGDLTLWSGTWGLAVPAEGYNSVNSLNDSPGANYPDNANTVMAMAEGVDPSGAMSGTVSFWAKWQIEDVWDCAFFEVSTDGGASWTPVATEHTAAASGQGGQVPSGEPIFDDSQANWVRNTVDLAPWLSQTDLRFRFRLSSDTSINHAGFFVDDFEIMVVREQSVSSVPTVVKAQATVAAWPNPFNPRTALKFRVPVSGPVSLRIYDLQGHLVRILAAGQMDAGQYTRVWDGSTENGRRAASGAYFARLMASGQQVVTKLSLVK